ncbi:MAG: hypothetical protein A2505_11040 [Deltaproteobacteria bacterium RIFOXYD12_FULL_55_16]|nr:MAG: hypothetical protein A2505_11040 [Deltaproteobacteria bacterium RIFOXYD12_FULL_55_16]
MKEDQTATGERREMYHFLADLFLRPPTAALLALIKEEGAAALFQGDDEASSTWRLEINTFREELKAMADPVAEMEGEYTALFVLPSGILPHEAVYRDEQKRLGGRVTMAVAQFYKDAVMEMSEECIEMPDHLGMELEFMARLCGLEKLFCEEDDQISLQVCRALQQDFMNRHLGCWASQCCEAVINEAGYGFYRAVAQITMAFLVAEEEYLGREQKTGKENLVWESAIA